MEEASVRPCFELELTSNANSKKATFTLDAGASKLEQVFQQLLPNVTFEVRVFAIDTSYKTEMMPMSRPRNLRVSGLSSWQFKLHWDAPQHPGNGVSWYQVDVLEILDVSNLKTKTLFKKFWPGAKREMLVDGLKAGKAYEVYVVAVAKDGVKKASNVFLLSKRPFIQNVLVEHHGGWAFNGDMVGAYQNGKYVGGKDNLHDVNKGFGGKTSIFASTGPRTQTIPPIKSRFGVVIISRIGACRESNGFGSRCRRSVPSS